LVEYDTLLTLEEPEVLRIYPHNPNKSGGVALFQNLKARGV